MHSEPPVSTKQKKKHKMEGSNIAAKSNTNQDYSKLTKKTLSKLCEARGLLKNGKKSQLIDVLEIFDKSKNVC